MVPGGPEAQDGIAEQVLLSEPMAAPGGVAGYNPLVVEHFCRPRHPGQFPPGPDVIQTRAGSRAQGAEVALSLRLERDRIAAVRFQAYGCPHFLAAASVTTELLPGLVLADLGRWQAAEVGKRLAFPVEKRGRLLILEDAVRAAVQNR